MLVENFAADNDLRLGQRVALVTPNGVEKFRLVGLIAKDGPGQINNGTFGLIPLETAQALFNRANLFSQIDIVAVSAFNSTEGLEALRLALPARAGSAHSVTYPAAQGRRITQMLGNYQIGLNLMSGMALFVGAFLIYNAFSMTVIERTREIGFLRTIGMTRRQVAQQVLAEAGLMGVIGGVLGLVFGLALTHLFLFAMTAMSGYRLTFVVPWRGIVTGLVLAWLVSQVAAMLPARRAARISVLEAIHYE